MEGYGVLCRMMWCVMWNDLVCSDGVLFGQLCLLYGLFWLAFCGWFVVDGKSQCYVCGDCFYVFDILWLDFFCWFNE